MLLSHKSCPKSNRVKPDLVISKIGIVRIVLLFRGGYIVFRYLARSIDRLSLIEISSVCLRVPLILSPKVRTAVANQGTISYGISAYAFACTGK